MSAHPKDDVLLDLVEGGDPLEARRHVTQCAGCASRIAEAQGVLERTRDVEVPEPPAFYWSSLRHSIGRRIAEEPPRPRWFLRLLPIAAVSVALAVIALRPPAWQTAPGGTATPSAALDESAPGWSPLPPVEEDEGLAVLEGLAASGNGDWYEGRGLGWYLEGLSDEDSATLARALRQGDGEGAL